MQPYASPFVSNLLKAKKQNEEEKWKIPMVWAKIYLHPGQRGEMKRSLIHGNIWAWITWNRKPGNHRRSYEGTGVQKEHAKDHVKPPEHQEPALGGEPKLFSHWRLRDHMRSYNGITKLTKNRGRKERRRLAKIIRKNTSQPRTELNVRNSISSKGSNSPLAPKCYQEAN